MVAARYCPKRVGSLAALCFILTVACNAIVGIEDPVIIDAGSGECLLNSDCPNEDDVCIFSTCSPPCNADRDCPEGARCLKTAAGTACVTNSAAKCTKDSCPDGSICSDGVCRNDCRADPEVCLKDQICDEDGVCRGTDPEHDQPADQGQAGSDAGPEPSQGGSSTGGGKSATGGKQSSGGQGGVDSEPRAGSSGRVQYGGQAGSGDTVELGGQGGSSGAAGSLGQDCEPEGLLACVGYAATGRLRCEQGQWKPFTPCPDGTLCDNGAEEPGACATVPEECRGRQPNEAFCQDATRIECGPDLVTLSSEACASAQHCTLGTGSWCAMCLSNEHRCVDTLLQVCNSEHTGFDDVVRCTDDPCNAEAGACTTLVCLEPGALRCDGDRLERCSEAQDGFELVEQCGEGLCDSEALECDICAADSTWCEPPSTLVSCSADGQRESESSCSAPTPYCAGGRCVECTEASHCAAPNDCYSPACNTGTGQCELNFKGTGSTCEGGYCNAAAQCVECLQEDHCSVSNDCYSPTCNSYQCGQQPKAEGSRCATGFCDGDGSCVECTQASHCPRPDECETAVCSASHTCGLTPHAAGQSCSTGVCDGDGKCVQCTEASHCPSGNECQTAVCSASHTCGLTPLAAGESCSTGVCDGNGKCVECVSALQCLDDEICRDFACINAYHTIGWQDTSGSASLAVGVMYLKRLPVIEYDAQLLAFDVVGTASGASAKLALYLDNGSGTAPTGSPVAATQTPIALIDGARSVSALPGNYVLQSGTTYWLAIKINVGTSLRAGSSSVVGREVVEAYSDPFQPFSGATIPGTYLNALALYLEVVDIE